MANYIRPKGITKVDWAKALRTVEQKFPEVIVEPNKTTKNKGSSDSALMQEMFPASPIYAGQLTNNIAREQKVTLLAKGVVDDGGHTFGVVDRNFGLTPGPLDLDFDTSTLLDITPYWHISGSFRKEPAARKFTPQPLKSPTSYVQTYAEYEEGIVYLNNQTVGTITFNNYFSTAPYVNQM
jgi:hypothetical protein